MYVCMRMSMCMFFTACQTCSRLKCWKLSIEAHQFSVLRNLISAKYIYIYFLKKSPPPPPPPPIKRSLYSTVNRAGSIKNWEEQQNYPPQWHWNEVKVTGKWDAGGKLSKHYDQRRFHTDNIPAQNPNIMFVPRPIRPDNTNHHILIFPFLSVFLFSSKESYNAAALHYCTVQKIIKWNAPEALKTNPIHYR